MKIIDPQAIRALAHPVRLDLIELLGGISPATAARCGRILGVSQASCSFHLRQLAKYGFVEDAGPGQDRRERRWSLVDRHLRVDSEGDLDPAVVGLFEQVLAKREAERIVEYFGRGVDEPAEWRRVAAPKVVTIPLSDADVAEIKGRWNEILAPYMAKAEANDMKLEAGQRYVRFFLAAAPLPHFEQDLELGESDNAATD